MSLRDFLYHPVSGKTNNLLLLILALVPAILLFTFPSSVFSNGIDPPLAWVFNFLIMGNIALGKDIIFPHGPLAFLMYPLPLGSNIWIAIALHLAARIFLAYSLLKLATRKPIGYIFIALISSIILLAVNDLLLTLIQITVLSYLNFFERRNVWWLIPALIITPLALFIKAFVGIVILVITLSFAGIMLYRAFVGFESWYRLLLLLIVPFILLLVWLGMYGSFSGIGGYLVGMVELAADNSAAVAVYPINNWLVISLALVSGLGLVLLNLKNIALVRFLILLSPALFAIWKYGMARQDYLHASMLFVFVLFALLVFNILSGKFRLVNVFLTLFCIGLFYIILQKSFYFEPFQFKTSGVQSIVSKAINSPYFADTSRMSSDKAIARNKLDQHILDLIGNKSTDIYPWDYSYIPANELNWQPRPVIQSYASYTRKLDQLNSRHFDSEKAADFIIWELRKITRDLHGGTLESIDGRYLLNDEPDALRTMICNYELAGIQRNTFPVLLLKKRAEKLSYSTKLIKRTKATWNTWIDVPDSKPEILQASVEIKRNLYGRIKSFLYKDDAAFVYYLLDNGDIRMYRIVPKNAAYGLWINPLVMNPESGISASNVRKIMFRCSNTAMMNNEIDVNWEEVSFFGIDSEPVFNVVDSFFGMKNSTYPEQLLQSNNDLESEARYWSAPDKSNLSLNGSNHTLILKPGDYSASFQYPLDSLPVRDTAKSIIIRAGLWAKANPNARAVLVISIEKDSQSLLWKAVDIQNFIHDNKVMNFATNFVFPGKDILEQKGLTLKVYAWNTGKDDLELDDFSVKIEAW